MAFGQQRAARVKRLVAVSGIRVTNHRMDDDLVACCVDPSSVAAEHDGQLLLGDADPAQRPQVVMVERGRANRHGGPADRNVRLTSRSDVEP